MLIVLVVNVKDNVQRVWSLVVLKQYFSIVHEAFCLKNRLARQACGQYCLLKRKKGYLFPNVAQRELGGERPAIRHVFEPIFILFFQLTNSFI